MISSDVVSRKDHLMLKVLTFYRIFQLQKISFITLTQMLFPTEEYKFNLLSENGHYLFLKALETFRNIPLVIQVSPYDNKFIV